MNLFPFSAVVAVAIDPSFVDTILNDSEADPKKRRKEGWGTLAIVEILCQGMCDKNFLLNIFLAA